MENVPEPGGGPDLFRLVRYWSRRWARTEEDAHVQHILVVEAVDAVRGTAVTCPDVAHQLGVDRSVASRMIAAAEASGYVDRRTCPADARRVTVTLTADGRALLAAAHAWQQSTFDALVAHWPAADRRRLARYLHRLASEVADG